MRRETNAFKMEKKQENFHDMQIRWIVQNKTGTDFNVIDSHIVIRSCNLIGMKIGRAMRVKCVFNLLFFSSYGREAMKRSSIRNIVYTKRTLLSVSQQFVCRIGINWQIVFYLVHEEKQICTEWLNNGKYWIILKIGMVTTSHRHI